MTRGDEKANLMLGLMAAKKSDWPTATDYDQKALALQPDDPDANLELAKAYIATKAARESPEAYRARDRN